MGGARVLTWHVKEEENPAQGRWLGAWMHVLTRSKSKHVGELVIFFFLNNHRGGRGSHLNALLKGATSGQVY